MIRQEIARGNGYSLVSIGNGWAYEFGHDGNVLWFQDDDATQFRAEFDALEESQPDLHTSGILARLWDIYA